MDVSKMAALLNWGAASIGQLFKQQGHWTTLAKVVLAAGTTLTGGGIIAFGVVKVLSWLKKDAYLPEGSLDKMLPFQRYKKSEVHNDKNNYYAYIGSNQIENKIKITENSGNFNTTRFEIQTTNLAKTYTQTTSYTGAEILIGTRKPKKLSIKLPIYLRMW